MTRPKSHNPEPRACAAPGCSEVFAPSKFCKEQRYCSTACQEAEYNKQYNSTHDLSKYRKSGECLGCGNERRINNSDICDSCVGIILHGCARKPIVGKCSSCNRGPLTLSAGECRMCYSSDVPYQGLGSRLSHGEALLRKEVARLYPKARVIHNHRPEWLHGRGRSRMEIDVSMPELMIGFEFDGRPHTDSSHPGFEDTVRRDVLKCQQAVRRGWTLVKVRSYKIIDQLEPILYSVEAYHEHGAPPHPALIDGRVVCVYPEYQPTLKIEHATS